VTKDSETVVVMACRIQGSFKITLGKLFKYVFNLAKGHRNNDSDNDCGCSCPGLLIITNQSTLFVVVLP
jgi:hypothetical protein